jgi:serine/threonine protein phosphatase PrpC
VRGETACLICTQTQQFLFWFSVGDCVAYVLHPEFARLGQYALNQRQFYEWIGRANTFDRQVPCYTSGVRELRQSDHVIALITDGLLECGARPFADPQTLYDSLTSRNIHGLITLESNVGNVLQRVHAEQGQDSATIVAWQYVGNQTGASPSEQ